MRPVRQSDTCKALYDVTTEICGIGIRYIGCYKPSVADVVEDFDELRVFLAFNIAQDNYLLNALSPR